MNKKQLVEIMENPAMTDEQVFESIKKYASERYDPLETLQAEDITEYLEVSKLAKNLRPRSIKMMEDYLITNHGNCCS